MDDIEKDKAAYLNDAVTPWEFIERMKITNNDMTRRWTKELFVQHGCYERVYANEVVFECPVCHGSKFSINVLSEMFNLKDSLKFATNCNYCGNTIAAKINKDLSVETKTIKDLLHDFLK